MDAETKGRLDRLEAIEAVRQQIGRYALAGDRHNDPEIMKMLFTADAIWDAKGFGRFDGRDAIVAGLSDIARQKVLWSLHFPASPLIDISEDGTSAKAFWWLWELATLREDGGEESSSFMGGTYEAVLQKEGTAWRFKRIDLSFQTITPFRDGWNLIKTKD